MCQTACKKYNIYVRPFFDPLRSMPAFAPYCSNKNMRKINPISYDISPYGICLPSGATLSEKDVDYVCTVLRNILLRVVIDVKYGNQKTIRELWNDDLKLKELIKKTYDWELKHGCGSITTNRLRQNSKVYLSKQSVSNFRPTAAKLIYNNYGNYGFVWDMSCGWGGRLFGFAASNCKKYIGTEPAKETFKGLKKIVKDFNIQNIELLNIGSEDYKPIKNSLDLCFTSPPYFDTEKYSNDTEQ